MKNQYLTFLLLGLTSVVAAFTPWESVITSLGKQLSVQAIERRASKITSTHSTLDHSAVIKKNTLLQQTSENTSDTTLVYNHPDTARIGYHAYSHYDDLEDNIHIFKVAEQGLSYILEASITSSESTEVVYSINEQYSTRIFVPVSDGQSFSVDLNPAHLRVGDNTIRFLSSPGKPYAASDIKVHAIHNTIVSPLTIHQGIRVYGDQVYVTGHALTGVSKLRIQGQETSIGAMHGNYEALITLPTSQSTIDIQYTYEEVTQSIKYDISSYDSSTPTTLEEPNKKTEIDAAYLASDMASKEVKVIDKKGVLSQVADLAVETTRHQDRASLPEGVRNITPEGKMYRFSPHRIQFSDSITIGLPYDTTATQYTYADVMPYYFDEMSKRWESLPIVKREQGYVYFKTDHFSDYVNGVIVAPENSEMTAHTPVSIDQAPLAHPMAELNIIAPPSVDQHGGANAVFPIEVPAGRGGLTPSIALTYNSNGKEGWVGYGWSLDMPSIKVDTRWGMPAFNAQKETEIYTLNGKQLIYDDGSLPNRHEVVGTNFITGFKDRNTSSTRRFYERQGNNFAKIERVGTATNAYTWIVTKSDGTKFHYGNTANSIKKGLDNNVVEWHLGKIEDVHGNEVKYTYETTPVVAHLRCKYIEYNNYGSSTGKYRIDFTSSTSTGPQASRIDTKISHHDGVTSVDDRQLSKISVSYSNQTIRSYDLVYDTTLSPFGNSMLKDVVERDANNTQVLKHSFSYYNDIMANGNEFYSPVDTIQVFNCNTTDSCPRGGEWGALGTQDWDGDGIINCLDNNPSVYNPLQSTIDVEYPTTVFSPQCHNSSRLTSFGIAEFDTGTSILGTSRSSGGSVGASVNVGLGFNIFAMGGGFTVNGSSIYSKSNQFSLIANVDMNGDGLSDVLYRNGEQLLFRAHKVMHVDTGGGFTTKHTYDTPVAISGIQRFLQSHNEQKSINTSATLGVGFAGGNSGVNQSYSSSLTDIYITDANGDGLPDIAYGGVVYFNHLSDEGIPTFTRQSQPTENMILYGGAIDSSILFPKPFDDTLQIPKYDVVKVWEAPSDGSITLHNLDTQSPINGKVSIETDNNGLYGFPLATQKGNCRLWHGTIGSIPSTISSMPPAVGLNCQGEYTDPCELDSNNNGIKDCEEALSSCQDTIRTESTIITPDKEVLSAEHHINSKSQINSSASAVYRAGKSIVLDVGFYAENASILSACIQLCKSLTESIYANNVSNKKPEIRVKKGQKIYFRAHVTEEEKVLKWNPKVEYTSINGKSLQVDRVDYTGDTIYQSSYKNAFLLHTDSPTVLPGSDGTLVKLSAPTLVCPGAKDDISVKVTKRIYRVDNSHVDSTYRIIQEDVLYEHMLSSSNGYSAPSMSVGQIPIVNVLNATEQKFTAFHFELKCDTKYDWTKVKWIPLIQYEDESFPHHQVYAVTSKTIYKPFTAPFKPSQKVQSPHYNAFTMNHETGQKDYYLHPFFNLDSIPGCADCPSGNVLFTVTKNNDIVYKNDIVVGYNSVTLGNAMPYHFDLDTLQPKQYEINLYGDTSAIVDRLFRNIIAFNSNSGIGIIDTVMSANSVDTASTYELKNFDVNLYAKAIDQMGSFHDGWGQFMYSPTLDDNPNTPSDDFGALMNLARVANRDDLKSLKIPLLQYQERIKNNANSPDSVSTIVADLEKDTILPPRSFVQAFPRIKTISQGRSIRPKEKWVGPHPRIFAEKARTLSTCPTISINNSTGDDTLAQKLEVDFVSGTHAVHKLIEGKTRTLHYGLNVSPVNIVSNSVTLSSTSNHKSDFIDINGDGYPDIFSKDTLILSNPLGGLGGLPELYHSTTAFDVDGSPTVGINEANTTGTVPSGVYPYINHGTTPSGNTRSAKATTDIGLSSSLSGVNINDETNVILSYDHINKDGVVERESKITTQKVANFSYNSELNPNDIHFWNNTEQKYQDFNSRVHSNSSSKSVGLQLFHNNSLTLGYSTGVSTGSMHFDRIDINGDGLKDLVYQTSNGSYHVDFNVGRAFVRGLNTIGFNGLDLSVTTKNSSNSYHFSSTIDVPFFGAKGGVSIHSTPISRSVSRTKTTFQDYNGDGYPDLLKDIGDNKIEVRYAMVGRTNKLKSITSSAGGKYEVDYQVSAPTYNDPSPKWNVSKIKVSDIHNQAVQGPGYTTTYYRFHNARYDRRERTSLGHEIVRSIELKVPDNDPTNTPQNFEANILRQKVDIYHNKNYHLQGKVKESYTAKDSIVYTIDADRQYTFSPTAAQLLSKTTTDYELRQMTQAPAGWTVSATVLPETFDVGGTKGLAASYCLMTEQRSRTYEGGQHMELVQAWDYDDKGRVTTYTHNGGEYTATTSYYNTPSLVAKNIISIPKLHEVKEGTTLKRKRTIDSVDPSTGDILTTSIHDGTGLRTITATYDSYGNIKTITTPLDQDNKAATTTITYDTDNYQYPTQVTHSYDGTTYSSTTAWDYRYGKPTQETDIGGNTYTYTYDNIGRLATALHPREASANKPYTYKHEYFGGGNNRHRARTSLYNEDNNSDIHIMQYADGLGRIVQSHRDYSYGDITQNQPTESERRAVSGMDVRDYLGRVIKSHHPQSISAASGTQIITSLNPVHSQITAYDIKDRATTILDEAGHTTTVAHAITGGKHVTTTTVDNGTHSADYISATHTDVNGRTTRTEQHKIIGGATTVIPVVYAYDGIGQPTTITSVDNKTITYTYNIAGEVTEKQLPDSGRERFTYDKLGNLKTRRTEQHIADNETILYKTDALGRLKTITYPQTDFNTQNISDTKYFYYGAGSGVNTGRLHHVIDAGGMRAYTYDHTGSVASEKRTMPKGGGVQLLTFLTQYETDSWGRMQEVTYPDGEKVTYAYDFGGSLKNVVGKTETATPKTLVDRVWYNHYGERTRIDYGNGTREVYTYDNLIRRLEGFNLKSGSTTLLNHAYTYDYVGNIKTTANTGTTTTLGGNYNYAHSYDNLGRLTTSNGSWTGTTNSRTYAFSMTFDDMHRITSKDESGTYNGSPSLPNIATYNYTNASHPRAVSSITGSSTSLAGAFVYDANGNMKQYNSGIASSYSKHMSWNDNNRMRLYRGNTGYGHYVYDSNGERVLKGTGQYTVASNGSISIGSAGYTLYPNGYTTLSSSGDITKHYYMGSKRIASRLDVDQNYGQGHLSHPDFGDPNDIMSDDLIDAWTSIGSPVQSSQPPTPSTSCNNAPIGSELQNQCSCTVFNSCSDVIYFYHSDHLGSNTYFTNSTGGEYQFLLYLPYGNTFVEQKVAGQDIPYLFNGKLKDEESGYTYMINRYLDSDLALFTSPDKKSELLPHMSPYLPMAGNSLRYIDPDGNMPVDALGDPPTPTVAGLFFEAFQSARSGLFNLTARVVGSDKRMRVNYQSNGGIPYGNPVVVETPEKQGFLRETANVVLDVLSIAPLSPASKGAVLAKSASKSGAVSAVRSINGNSKSSQKAQHLYEIFEIGTGNVVKTGVSGGKVSNSGKSYRATGQVNKWNKTEGAGKYDSRIIQNVPAGPGARQKILNAERANANRLLRKNQLQDFDKHKRPR